MSRAARVPRECEFLPFRGSEAVARGRLSRSMLRGPTWRRLFPDVYLHVDAPLHHRVLCEAVALTLPDGTAVGGLSAAYLWGVDLLPHAAPVTVVAPRDRRLRADPRRTVHYSTLAPGDLTHFAGVPVTTPERTAFDLGRRGPRVDALVAVDALLHRHVITREALRTLAAERCGWPGIPQLRDVLSLAEPLAESPMESRLRLLLLDASLPPPTAQHRVLDARGRFVARVDLAWPELRLAVEYDGDQHREKAQFRRDVARLNALRAAGWTVLRFTAGDVLRQPGRTARQVATVLRELTGGTGQ